MELKHRIREAMEGAGLKPLQLANAVGVSSGAVTHWLNGATSSLKAETANRISQVTGYSASWLVSGLGDKKGNAIAPIEYTGPSPLARELALVFDMIPEADTLRRNKAYALAITAIAGVLEGDSVTLERVPVK